MATFHNQTAPSSLENVLTSLQDVLEHNRYYSQSTASQPDYEPFSNQQAEQHDDPLVLDEPAGNNITEILQQHIPVLKDIISTADTQPLAEADIEKTLDALRTELNGIVADVMLDAREHLEKQDFSSQEVMETGLKQFIQELIDRLPR